MPADANRAKYLQRHATDEARLAHRLAGTWSHSLVVPACAESVSLLDGYREASRSASGRVLVILVVNATADAHQDTHRANQTLLADVAALGTCTDIGDGATLRDTPDFDLLCIDRATDARRFAPKQGVGLARRIGCDLALALHDHGRVGSSWLHTTDADATLPPDYFRVEHGHMVDGTAAMARPFHHTAGDLPRDHARALRRYELSLRYFVVGLARAGSPYAYHAIGSTMSVDVSAYVSVRGIPLRQAGEDFYALNKLAKVGAIIRPDTAPIQLAGRRSRRVPFGTGPATERIAARLAAGDDMAVYHPHTFVLLGALMSAVDEFARTRNWDAAVAAMPESPHRGRLLRALDALGMAAAMGDAAHRCASASALRRRCHEWLDAFRTLKLVHALRDAGLAMQPWRTAIAASPFDIEAADEDEVAPLCEVLARAEPTRTGL